MNIEEQYLYLLKTILDRGVEKKDRTGTGTITLPFPTMLQHDMSEGFPLFTTKKMGVKSISAELEFFIKGYTDKKWLQDRKCTIWNEWCRPSLIDKNLSLDLQKIQQVKENDLGPVYGFNWRHFGAIYNFVVNEENPYKPNLFGGFEGYDQLEKIVDTLKNNPDDRRMICSSWNPNALNEVALPACHFAWGVQVVGNKLNLWYIMRSQDVFLGAPYNIASYAILLKLLALEGGFEEGYLTTFAVDCHIYLNHIDQVMEQMSRDNYELPQLDIKNFTDIYNWKYTDIELSGYKHQDSIKAPVAI